MKFEKVESQTKRAQKLFRAGLTYIVILSVLSSLSCSNDDETGEDEGGDMVQISQVLSLSSTAVPGGPQLVAQDNGEWILVNSDQASPGDLIQCNYEVRLPLQICLSLSG